MLRALLTTNSLTDSAGRVSVRYARPILASPASISDKQPITARSVRPELLTQDHVTQNPVDSLLL